MPPEPTDRLTNISRPERLWLDQMLTAPGEQRLFLQGHTPHRSLLVRRIQTTEAPEMGKRVKGTLEQQQLFLP